MGAKSVTILIVEDDEGTRELLRDACAMTGYEVKTASDGQKALSILRTENIQLVITDINMPRMDGLTMLEKLRKEDNQTPVLMLSARNEKKVYASALTITWLNLLV